jgi:hypothetical protein
MRRGLSLLSFTLVVTGASLARAQTQSQDLGTTVSTSGAPAAGAPANAEAPKPAVEAARPLTTLSMDPAEPELSSLPSGVTPSFGAVSTRPSDWRFDFHGLLFVPLRVGFNSRLQPQAGQSKNVFHAPPVTPDNFESFEYTNVAPDPWAQVNFSYGNRDVTATVIIAARSITEGNEFFNPPDQLGINDAFLTYRVANTERMKIQLNMGAFANRYGNMGEFDSGRYGTPIIARIGGVGITETGTFDFGPVRLLTEIGLMGQLNKAPLSVEPAGWNGYLDPNAGTSYVPHLHLGLSYLDWGQFGFHLMRALSQDDRATPTNQPDGYIDILAVDARLTLKRFGHFYLGLSRVDSHHARAVSDIIQIMNAPGGLGLMTEYFGPQSGGGGDLTILGAQYDLSLGNLLRYPGKFDGTGPDVVASLFGIFTSVSSAQHDPQWDGVKKLKYGAEISYSPFNWLAVAGRYDRVIRNVDDASQTSAVLSPRLIFRSNFAARDQIVLQYSHWFNGSNVVWLTGTPPAAAQPLQRLDEDVLSLMAAMWW